MASSTTSMPPAAAAMTSKFSARPSKSKLVKLKLSPALLANFPSDSTASKSSRAKSISSSTPSAPTPSNPMNEPSPAVNASDSNAASTPAPSGTGLLAPPPNPVRRKGIPGPKPGMKRNASQLDINGVPKPRGKPGPKKKPRLGENGQVVNGIVAPVAPKLGPKANQGAINACLRALDRTGKPCRKWEKMGFRVKSFTGYAWSAGAYAAHKKQNGEFAGDVKSDSSSSGDVKATQESSAVASEKSNSGADTETPMPPADVTSSPAPFITVNPT